MSAVVARDENVRLNPLQYCNHMRLLPRCIVRLLRHGKLLTKMSKTTRKTCHHALASKIQTFEKRVNNSHIKGIESHLQTAKAQFLPTLHRPLAECCRNYPTRPSGRRDLLLFQALLCHSPTPLSLTHSLPHSLTLLTILATRLHYCYSSQWQHQQQQPTKTCS